jgi:magnesium-transporting ATPase (P-type)
MLTGESVPVSKVLSPAPSAASLGDRKCMCYSATAVTSGQARAVVVATGDSAEIGQINKMVNTVRTRYGCSLQSCRRRSSCIYPGTCCSKYTCLLTSHAFSSTQRSKKQCVRYVC